MGFFFGIYAGFGQDQEALKRAALAVEKQSPLRVGARTFRLWPTQRKSGGPAPWSLCVIPERVGAGAPHLAHSPAELSELARGLYGVLRTLEGYTIAIVDWESDSLVTSYGGELEEDWGEWLVDGVLHGIVISRAERERLSAECTRHLEPFAPGFEWIPYRGHDDGNWERFNR